MRSTPRAPQRLAVLAAALLGALLTLLPRPALAGVSVRLTSRELVEVDGRWKLAFTIDYGSVPQLPHIPMIFNFEPTVLYERALTDKSPDKPIINRIPLSNQQGLNESLDVGFSDASGKIFKITKFDFVIRRDRGFESGEYDLKIKREDDGQQMGQTIKVILKGDNPIVDRRAMVFAGEKKSKKAADPDKTDGDKTDDKKDAPAAPKEDAKSEDGEEKKSGDDVPKVPPKQGGCGCRVVGEEAPAGGPLAVLGLAVAVAVASRRRRAA
jgi:MYXO-CTERM domain-containing protein